MIRGLRTHEGGFTLVELMVVMSVTIALLGSALLAFQGRVPRTQFASAINGLSTQLTDIGNQVTSGYYPSQNSLTCQTDLTAPGGLKIENSGTNSLGRNSDCIYIGQVVHFGAANGSGGTCPTSLPNDNCDTVDVYTVYGRRVMNGGGIVTNLSEASPQVTDVNKTSFTIGYGAHIVRVKVGSQDVGGVAYLQSFGGNRDVGSTVPTGAAQVGVVPLIGVSVGQPADQFAQALNTSSPGAGLYSAQNPSEGVLICLKSGGSDQYAIVKVAVGGVSSSTQVNIVEQAEWSTKCG